MNSLCRKVSRIPTQEPKEDPVDMLDSKDAQQDSEGESRSGAH